MGKAMIKRGKYKTYMRSKGILFVKGNFLLMKKKIKRKSLEFFYGRIL